MTCESCNQACERKRKDQRFCSPTCAAAGKRVDMKMRYEANREAIKAQVRQYRIDSAEVIRVAARARYLANRPAILEQKRVYTAEHKDEIRAYRTANAEKLDKYRREYVERNRARLAVQGREQRKRTKAARARSNRAWRLANAEACRLKDHKRRVLIAENKFAVTPRDWTRCLQRFNHSCAYCGAREPVLHMEHVIPISRGGRHSVGNLIPACESCNCSKHNLYLTEWLLKRMRMEAAA